MVENYAFPCSMLLSHILIFSSFFNATDKHFFIKNKNTKTSLITLQTTYILDSNIMLVKIYIIGETQI
jgi:hypothetical protein